MTYRRPLVRDNPDLPKSAKDPDRILTRMEHFWSGKGRLGEGIMSPHDQGLADKAYTEWYDHDHPDPFRHEGGAELRWEGSVSSPVSNILRLHGQDHRPYPDISIAENEAINQISPIHHWATTRMSRENGQEPRKHETLHIRAGRFSRNDDSRELEPSNDPKEFNSRYSKALNSLIRGRSEHLGKMVGSTVHKLVRGNAVPEIEKIIRERHAGDMGRFRQLVPSVFDPNYIEVENITGLDSSNDYIDLSTGTWAKISPDQFFPH